MFEFMWKSVSMAGAPDIEFAFSGSLGTATCAGATMAAVAHDSESALVRISTWYGRLIADVTVRKLPADENLTAAVMNIVAALLWSRVPDLGPIDRWPAPGDRKR